MGLKITPLHPLPAMALSLDDVAEIMYWRYSLELGQFTIPRILEKIACWGEVFVPFAWRILKTANVLALSNASIPFTSTVSNRGLDGKIFALCAKKETWPWKYRPPRRRSLSM